MSRRALALLALIAVVAAASFWWQSEQAARQTAAADALPVPAGASDAEKLTLTQESVDALTAENTDMRSRISDLEAQGADAERLIQLKTTRLQALEKSAPGQ